MRINKRIKRFFPTFLVDVLLIGMIIAVVGACGEDPAPLPSGPGVQDPNNPNPTDPNNPNNPANPSNPANPNSPNTPGAPSDDGVTDGGGVAAVGDVGVCFQSCLSLLSCDPSINESCGGDASAAYSSSCQTACEGANKAQVQSVTDQGCGMLSTALSTLSVACLPPDESCNGVECSDGQRCVGGACTSWVCNVDALGMGQNGNRNAALQLNFAGQAHRDLTLCGGEEDWYAIDIPPEANARLDVSFTHRFEDVDVEVFADGGEDPMAPIGRSTSATDRERIVIIPAPEARRMYVRVYMYSSNATSMMTAEMAPKSTNYNMYLSVNLPAPICQRSTECGEGNICTPDGVCAPPPPCMTNEDCGFQTCDVATGRCVECLTTEDCNGFGTCDPATFRCVECLSSADCSEGVCSEGSCVECLVDTDCPAGACNEFNRCIPDACNDRLEPNEDQATASLLMSSGMAQESGLYICGDQDYFTFTTTASSNFYAALRFIHDDGDLELELIDGAGSSLARRVTSTDNEFIGYPGLPPGTYFLRVFGAGFAVNIYDLSVDFNSPEPVCLDETNCNGGRCDRRTSLCLPPGYCEANIDCEVAEPVCTANRCGPCTSDPYEPNDDITAPIPIDSAIGQPLNLCAGADFFLFNLNQGQAVDLSISFSHMLGDVDMRLYGPDEGVVASSLGISDTEEISFTAMVAGNYILHVYGFREVYNDYTLNATFR